MNDCNVLQLDDVKWSLGWCVSSKGNADQRTPHATLEFDLKSADKVEPLLVQLDHRQLFGLHEQMHQIQEKLDSLK
jgi:hypothetical protein